MEPINSVYGIWGEVAYNCTHYANDLDSITKRLSDDFWIAKIILFNIVEVYRKETKFKWGEYPVFLVEHPSFAHPDNPDMQVYQNGQVVSPRRGILVYLDQQAFFTDGIKRWVIVRILDSASLNNLDHMRNELMDGVDISGWLMN